jgi:hypothetical protein
VAKTMSYGVQSMNYRVSSVVDGSLISVRQWLPPPDVDTKAVVQVTHGIPNIVGGTIALRVISRKTDIESMQATCGGTGFPCPRPNSAEPASIFGPTLRRT